MTVSPIREASLLRVLSLLGGETVQGDFEYGRIMAAIYEAIATFRDRHVRMFENYEYTFRDHHVAMFENYEDGFNASAARCARRAAEVAYEVGDLHAELATVLEGIAERQVHPSLRHFHAVV